MDESKIAPIMRLYALKAYYRVVYLNGLNEPVETLIGASSDLVVDAEDTIEQVCQFIQSTIDLDCRRVLFLYRDVLDDLK